MGAGNPRPVVLDAGALIAFERNQPKLRRLIQLAVEYRVPLHVPAGVLAQVWRDGRRQAHLARLVASETLRVHSLDSDEAKAAGVLCGRTQTSDIVDACVVLLARRHHATVVTSDAGDLLRIDSTLTIAAC